jgi:hypothetical protein
MLRKIVYKMRQYIALALLATLLVFAHGYRVTSGEISQLSLALNATPLVSQDILNVPFRRMSIFPYDIYELCSNSSRSMTSFIFRKTPFEEVEEFLTVANASLNL